MQDLTLGLSGRVAIVTGAARGTGRSTVELLMSHGVKVVAGDINPAVKDLIQTGKVVAFVGDSSEEATAVGIVELAMTSFGRLDVLVNNAGQTLNKPFIETSVADWDSIMAINARGYFLHAREAVKAMQKSGGGSIVNVASVVSAVGMKMTAAYAASKGAIAQLTKVIALEYGEQGACIPSFQLRDRSTCNGGWRIYSHVAVSYL